MKATKNQIMMFAVVCIVLNIVLGITISMLKIPFLFMDTMGTIICAAVFGPFWGAAVGLITNILTGILNNPVEIPFALVNMTIGLVVGAISRKWGFTLRNAVLTGLLLSIVAPLIGTPIAVWIFGGLTGGPTDFIVAWLLAAGNKIFTAAFIPRIVDNLVDKVASCVIAFYVISKLPQQFKFKGINNAKG